MMAWLMLAAALGSVPADGESEPPLVAGRDVAPPKKVKNVIAPFPDIARHTFPPVEGVVLLRLTLNETGHPVDIVVVKGTPIIDAAAIEAAKQWEYEPTLLAGVPRRVVLKAVVEFFLSAKSRQRYLVDLLSSDTEDPGLRVYAIQSLMADPGDVKAIQRALEKAINGENATVANAARKALATIPNR